MPPFPNRLSCRGAQLRKALQITHKFHMKFLENHSIGQKVQGVH